MNRESRRKSVISVRDSYKYAESNQRWLMSQNVGTDEINREIRQQILMDVLPEKAEAQLLEFFGV